ncbi:MAG: elongation factor G [Clostridiales bacterium]|nr:elongation factor G [Clostridiales bacterium]
MKVFPSTHIRNVGIVAHQGAGKTSLAEALIFNTGVISRLGKVDDGNTVSDYHPEELKRKSTVNTSLLACEWRDHKINVLDVPGFSDFFGEVSSTLRVADSLIMVLDAVAGVEVSTEIIWELADEKKIPLIAFVNRMDRENADFFRVYESMSSELTRQIVPVQIPIGKESSFSGMVDLIAMKAYKYENGKATEIPVPAELTDEAEHYRELMVEAAAEGDDEITLKYLDGEPLSDQEIIFGLKEGVRQGKVVPVLLGSAVKNIGADKLLDLLVDYAPGPLDHLPAEAVNGPTASLIFKTLADPYVGRISMFKVYSGKMKGDCSLFNANKSADEKVAQLSTMQGKTTIPLPEFNVGDIGIVSKLANTTTGDTLTTKDSDILLEGVGFPEPTLTVAIVPRTKGDEDKLGNAINRLLEEDPTLRYEKNAETRQTLITGVGEAHVNIVIDRLQRKFGVEVDSVDMKVPYRETIRGTAQTVEGKHKKQSGGHGQYGHVKIDIAPDYENDFTFEEKIFGGAVPKQYIPAVEKGMRESLAEGILAGFPVTNVKVTLVDGSYHDVDSSEMAFKIAANLAFKRACEQAKPVLLEPVMDVDILVPDQYMGDIMGDMNTKRGRIMGMEKHGNRQMIHAQAPLSEMHRYAIDLKSITQGRGKFTMKFAKYEEVPGNIADKVIAQAKADKQAE